MAEVSSEVFPQRVDVTGADVCSAGESLRGPSYFKHGEGIMFHSVGRVVSSDVSGNSISLECETLGRINQSVNTHETRLHQFTDTGIQEAVMNVRIDFWSDSIFRVKFGECELPVEEPEFPDMRGRMLIGTPDEGLKITVEENDVQIIARTSEVTLKIDKNKFRMRAYGKDGKLFWEQCRAYLFTSDIFDMSVAEHNGRKACFESFMLGGQEEIYGLGERFDHVNRKGKVVDFWNKDAIGVSNRRSYVNVPFIMSTSGYGMFLNSSARTEWEVGTLDGYVLGFGIEDDFMDYFIIYGPTPADILYKYSTLTGFSPTPPVWSFGLWMSRNSYLSWDITHEVADGLRKRGIPSDVLHLDTAWFKEDWNCDLRFSEERFPDPEGNMKKLRENGFRISLWQYNFIPPRENNINYKEGLEKGYFAKGKDGKPYAFPPGIKGSWIDDAIIDFSNPEAREWYAAQIRELIRMGAATIKTDFGEGIPEDAIYMNIDGHKFHNLYTLVYNAAVSDAIYDVSGERIVWARSGTAGSQRYPVHWGGDSQCEWSGLAGTLRGALSIGLSGFPFFSHDIGGFIGRPTPELYVRWAQFGLFSSHSRCHGAGNENSREPWTFGDEANRIFTDYAKLRYRLLPYIYNEAKKSSQTAKPMVRALVIDYPNDRNVRQIEDQYMFGDSLLIAPVLESLEDTNIRTLYLPEGTWIDYWTKEAIESRGEWIEREVDLDTMPIYVKSGSIILYGADRQYTNNEIGKIELLEVYGRDAELTYDDGTTRFTASSAGGRTQIEGLDYEPEIVVY